MSQLSSRYTVSKRVEQKISRHSASLLEKLVADCIFIHDHCAACLGQSIIVATISMHVSKQTEIQNRQK
jgi:hypothetical protein